MASTQLSLIGTLTAELHAQVIARLATASEQGLAYSTTETFFERGELTFNLNSGGPFYCRQLPLLTLFERRQATSPSQRTRMSCGSGRRNWRGTAPRRSGALPGV